VAKKRQIKKVAETLRVMAAPEPRELLRRRTATLSVVQGAEVDLGRHIRCDHPIIVGRDERVDFFLNDGSISRAHCSVERDIETGRYMLIDLGSTNGTTINGVRVHDRVPLSAGDKIFLGSSVLKFGFADELDLEYQNRLEEMVNIDALTGLFTKRQYDAAYNILVERANVDDTPLTVVVMDMDGLKEINDTHGHEYGSYAIQETASLIRDVLTDYGQVARFGGDEFVGCFPNLDGDATARLAEILRQRVNTHVFERNGVRFHPTLSIGIASYPRDVLDPNELFTAADRAMYKAKRKGKNRIATANDSMTHPRVG
jgi:diguanylate cyclase (GGDEF)-like protein